MWGKHAHISEVVDKDSSPSEIKRLMRVVQVHCNYQCSMLLEDIVGISDLDKKADLIQPGISTVLRFSLRMVLLCFVQHSDGHKLFTEIHQSKEPMGRVQAVIPNTPEAEKMILMMNKNFPAYIGNALKDKGLPEEFLMDLLKRSCCQTMMSEIHLCKWDSETGVLTTQREAKEKEDTVDLENALWFKNAFEDLELDMPGAPKALTPPPESLFNLDKDRSIKTIHDRNLNRPSAAGTPPWKNVSETVDMTFSDEDSTPSSSDEGPRKADAAEDHEVLASSDEVNGGPGVADGG